MFKVKVFSKGKCKEAWLASALAEYEKRLSSQLEVEWVLDKECRVETLPPSTPLIALDVQGILLSSEDLSRKLFTTWGPRIAFAIGSPEGLSKQVLAKATFRWSLSPLTFPHQITRLLLLEQLYRAFEIETGGKYHK